MAPDIKLKAKQDLMLPEAVSSPADVGRLINEIEGVDESLLQLQLRKGGEAVSLPKTSQLLGRTVELNKLNLLQASDRQQLKQFLVLVKAKAPVLHFSFSADPSVSFTEKLVTWLRREVHPYVLLSIGLQPSIGAGCMLRTNSKYFDFTLRHRFDSQRKVLLEKMAAGISP